MLAPLLEESPLPKDSPALTLLREEMPIREEPEPLPVDPVFEDPQLLNMLEPRMLPPGERFDEPVSDLPMVSESGSGATIPTDRI